MINNLTTLLVALLVVAQPTVAQPLGSASFARYTTADGLAFNAITALALDGEGYLWVGTMGGLNRYDGIHWDALPAQPEGAPTPVHQEINPNALAVDPHGHVWIGTNDGVYCYLPTTGRFKHYPVRPEGTTSLHGTLVSSTYVTTEGTVWVGTDDGLHRYRPAQDDFVHYAPDPARADALGHHQVITLQEAAGGDGLWVGTRGGLYRLDFATDRFERFTHDPADASSIPADDLFALHPDGRGGLWIGTLGEGLIHYDPSADRFTHRVHDPDDPTSLPANTVTAFLHDSRGRFWVATWGGGLAHFDPAAGTFDAFRVDPQVPQSLAHHNVVALLEDDAQVLWVGTYNGLNKQVVPLPFKAFMPMGKDSRPHPEVTALQAGPKGSYWIGTRGGGVFRWKPATGELQQYATTSPPPYRLSHDDVSGLWWDPVRRSLWVTTFEDGLNVLHVGPGGEPLRATQHFTHRPGDPGSLPTNFLYGVGGDGEGQVWVTTADDGVARYDPEGGTFTRYTHVQGDTTSVPYDRVWPIHHNRYGLWFGTLGGGGARYNAAADAFVRLMPDPGDPDGPSKAVLSLATAPDGTLWMGTLGGGLHSFHPTTGQRRHRTTADGLSDDIVTCVLADGRGSIWLGTSNGLSRYDPEADRFETFGPHDGLPARAFSFNACTEGPGGALLFGTAQGLVAFHPDVFTLSAPPPGVTLTRLDLFNKPYPTPAPPAHLQELRLSYDENHLGFHYAALDFRAPGENQYAYWLEGVDPGWVRAGPQASVSYPNLTPGRYVFRVRAANARGIWSTKAATLSIRIAPPPWRTAWAYLAYLILVTLAGTFAYRSHRERLRQAFEQEKLAERNRLLAETDRRKTEFFLHIGHEIRTPLTLLQVPLELMLSGHYGALPPPVTQQHQTMLQNAHRLGRLVNQILDLEKLDAGLLALAEKPVDLGVLVADTTAAFQGLAEEQQLTLTMEAQPRCIVTGDAAWLERVFTNLLSNAIKFTPPGGRIAVRVYPQDAHVVTVVEDTGLGIAAEDLPLIFNRFYQVDRSATRVHEGSGIGLALVQQTVTLHGGTTGVESVPGRGTTFTIMLPTAVAVADGHDRHAPAAAPGADTPPMARERSSAPPARPPHGGSPRRVAGGGASDGPPHARVRLPAPPTSQTNTPTLLIAEDDPDIRALVAELFAPAFHILEASNGAEALALVHTHLPDIVIADVMMPHLDGFTFCHQAKANPMTAGVPVLLLTALAADYDHVSGFQAGADAYLAKPFSSAVLQANVQSLLENRRRLRATQGGGGHPDISVGRTPFMTKVYQVITDHLCEGDFSPARLAQEVGYSRSRFNVLLRQEADCTPSQLINRVRLEHAARLLLEEDATVSEIAYAVGYNSLNFFSRKFKEQYGQTPSAYRTDASP